MITKATKISRSDAVVCRKTDSKKHNSRVIYRLHGYQLTEGGSRRQECAMKEQNMDV